MQTQRRDDVLSEDLQLGEDAARRGPRPFVHQALGPLGARHRQKRRRRAGCEGSVAMSQVKTCARGGFVAKVWIEAAVADPRLSAQLAWATNMRLSHDAARDTEHLAVAGKTLSHASTSTGTACHTRLASHHGNHATPCKTAAVIPAAHSTTHQVAGETMSGMAPPTTTATTAAAARERGARCEEGERTGTCTTRVARTAQSWQEGRRSAYSSLKLCRHPAPSGIPAARLVQRVSPNSLAGNELQ